jgi:hypothetical protein
VDHFIASCSDGNPKRVALIFAEQALGAHDVMVISRGRTDAAIMLMMAIGRTFAAVWLVAIAAACEFIMCRLNTARVTRDAGCNAWKGNQ